MAQDMSMMPTAVGHPAWCARAQGGCTVDTAGLGIHRRVITVGGGSDSDRTDVAIECPVGGGGGGILVVIERYEDDLEEPMSLIAFRPREADQTVAALVELLGMLDR